MIYTALDDFYLTPEQLEASPSRADGVTFQLETQLTRYGCDIIAEATVLLGLPQSVACTAQVLLHRFYCKRSLKNFDIKVSAIAMFWLAAKLEEVIEIDQPSSLKLRHVMVQFYRVIRRRDGKQTLDLLDPGSRQYHELKTAVVRAERHALRAFGFIVHVEHPHRFVLTFGQLLGMNSSVLQQAWNFTNDSLRLPLCIEYKAEVVACAMLFMASRKLKVPMPENPPWWHVFGVNEGQLIDVATKMCALYALPRAEYVVLARDYTSRGEDGKESPPLVLPSCPSPPPLQEETKNEVCTEKNQEVQHDVYISKATKNNDEDKSQQRHRSRSRDTSKERNRHEKRRNDHRKYSYSEDSREKDRQRRSSSTQHRHTQASGSDRRKSPQHSTESSFGKKRHRV